MNYLIKNGQVFDGSGAAGMSADVRVREQKIAEIGPQLAAQDEEVVDASGLLVVPGLVDLHVHVYSGMGTWAIDPADAGLKTGVTTMLDTGTAGSLTYRTFHRFVMPPAQEDIFALLNVSMIGCLQGHPDSPPVMGELNDVRYADVPSAVACIEAHRDRIIGVKTRLSTSLADRCRENEEAGLRAAREVAERTGTFFMVHHAASKIPPAQVLDTLRRGDVFTHLYHSAADSPFGGPDRAPIAELLEARERGVVFDVGHGAGAFSWPVAEAACQKHGFWPDTISTDIHSFNLHGPVYDLPTTMSKLLHLGMPLEAVVTASTGAPARAMRLDDRFGFLQPGRQADITLLKLETGEFELTDAKGASRRASQRLRAQGVFKRGEKFEIASAT